MRSPREQSKRSRTHGRSRSRALLLGSVTLALVLTGIVSTTRANHSTTTWDFGADVYTYDPTKIVVENGVAHLRKSFSITHNTQAAFDAGTHSGTVYNTSAPADGVKLSAPPTAGTYTSPAIDAGVATTTWKTLSHVRDLQQAAPPATFGAKASVGSQTTILELNAADVTRDGAVDIVATNTGGGTKVAWLYQSSAANPPTFSQKKITDDGAAGACPTGVDAGLFSVAAARHGIADLDNDLDPDLIEVGQQTINTKPLYLYLNPLTAPGGTPQCWSRWLIHGRLLEDVSMANINGDTYTSTDPVKNGRPIVDIVAVESTIGTGTSASPSGGVLWLRNDGTVAPDAPVFGFRSIDTYTLATAAAEGPTTVAIGDINNDGLIDVVAGWPSAYNGPLAKANTSPQIRGYLSGGGDPPTWTAFTLANVAACASAPCPDNSNDIWLADINGDGFLDVVHAAKATNTLTWYKNTCTATPCTPTGTWTGYNIDTASTGVTSLAPADLDLDGDIDVVGNSSSGTAGVVWYQNNGGDPVTWSKGTFTTSAGATGVVVANLHSNGDRAPDVIAGGSSGAGTIDWWPNALAHSNLRFQVRSWSQGDNTCSTPTGTFVGPDGSSGTYYTSTSETLRVADNQCLQYRASFFTNDAAKNPNLQSVTVSYERSYFTDPPPSIQPNTGVAYSRLTDFVETLGPGHAGGTDSKVQYQLCKVEDPVCYWWTGSAWANASSWSQSNDAATVKGMIPFFDNYTGYPAGAQYATFYFKAFLISDGTKQVELDAVAVQPDRITAILTSPVGAESWKVNEIQTISWTYTCEGAGAPCGNLKLEHSTDGGGTWSLISDAVTNGVNGSCSLGGNTGCYAWTIPASAASTSARVRVVDNDTSAVWASSLNFAITGAASLISPNGTEPPFTVNGSTTITWNITGTNPVKLEYSKDNFATAATVINPSAANGSNGGCTVPGGASGCYPWTVPDAISTTVKVRVTDTVNPALTATSDTAFTITGAVTVTAPNGGQTFTIGDPPITISWSTLGNIPTVKLEYSTNDGSTWTLITASAPSTPASPPTLGSGSYAWTAPTDTSSQFRIRVSDADIVNRPVTSDISDANFTVKGLIEVKSPTPGSLVNETYTVGNPATIAWATTGTIPNVKLEYSTDGGTTYPNQIVASVANGPNCGTLPAGATGCYTWTIPDVASSSVKVRVSDSRAEFSGTVQASSPNTFNVKGGLTAVTSPASGDVWKVGEVKTISWTSTGAGAIPTVNIEYSKLGNFSDTQPIAAAVASGPTGGSYSWTVADAIASTVKVRVKHPTEATVFADSAAFEIKGSLTLNAPASGVVWPVGSTQNITWATAGTLGDVKLEYSADGGTSYTEITPTTPAGNLSFPWLVPDAISTTVKVRITLVSDPTVTHTSANFKIRGSLALTAPNGGETWTVGEARTITWTKAGTLGDVKLEYSKDGGVTYPFLIADPIPASDLAYTWTVPDAISTTVKVRITLKTDATVTDASNADFAIKGSLTLTAPNGGESWTAGSAQTITWTKAGTFAAVKLEYSTDNFATASQITASTDAALGSYAWTVPDLASSNVKVRVTNTADPSVFDDSNATFTIKGGLGVTSPAGGAIWTVGEARTISWTSTGAGAIPTVNLEYSKNGSFTDAVVIATGVASGPTGGSYSWTVADAIASTVKVRVKHPTDASVTADSAAFTIKGSLALTAPVGGEAWGVGSTPNVTWTRQGSIANVKVEYSKDNFLTPILITASTSAATGTYAWTIPDDVSTTVKVRITNVDDPSVTATSPANFSIKGSLRLDAPNGGESWPIGSAQTITWTKTGTIGNVRLEYSTDGGVTYPNVIAPSIPATSLSHSWTVPDTPTAQARVKITSVDDTSVNDASDANFGIKGTVTLTAPNGTETWLVGESRNITWIKTGAIANVKLEYSTDGGATYPNLITASTPAGSSPYAWTVPDAIGTGLRVRITDVGDATVSDTSNANFSIKGSLALTAPVGGEVWTVAESRNITWTKTGAIANVKLEYSTDGGATYPNLITASTPAGSSPYAWTVPDAISASVRVRITNVDDTSVTSSSGSNFKIQGAVALTAPNGGETWIIGESRSITWTRTGSIANVKLEYSTDGGATYPNVIAASAPAGSGSYAWVVPDSLSTAVKVRVSDASDATVSDISNANFTIKGSLALTAPNGGEVWGVGTGKTITWTKAGTFATVKLEYSTDNFVTASLITASTDAALGSYSWTVPDNISSTVKVRVTSNADATLVDTSDANFKITGALSLTAPNGGEKWGVGTAQSITWTKTGSIANVKLEYSANGTFSDAVVIAASTAASAGSYAWTIPDALSTTVKVRVTDASDATVADASDGAFTILAGFTLSAPNGGEVWTVGSSQTIAWATGGSVANVKLEYSTDGGSTYPNVIVASTPNTGTFGWTVPDTIAATVRVRVSDVNNSDAFDSSNTNFKIRGGFAVSAPNGGEVWTVGESRTITWTTTGTIANIKLEYSKDNFTTPILIAASTGNTGTFAWTVPDDISATVRVRVTDVNDSTVFDGSNADFKIQGALALTAPNGGEKWTVGSSRTLTWTRTGSVANVKLEYSKDNFATASVIAASTPNTGSYTWSVPNDISATIKVRVADAGDSTVNDVSDATFKILGAFAVGSPNGGETWAVGATQAITWTTSGTVPNVKLEFSTNNFATATAITASTPNTGTYSWIIPDAISATVKVRVADAADAEANDVSDANFRIRGGLALVAPNGGETWTVGTTQAITWTTSGTIPNVKLEFSTDGGVTYPSVIAASVANTGSFSWTIPDNISNTVRVRVSDVTDASANDTSEGNFKIRGSLALSVPNGGEVWTIGAAQTITWTSAGTIPSVKLEYSKDNFGTATLIAASVANTGSFAWTVPDDASTTVRIRVVSTADATVFDDTNANFTIRGGFILGAPNGGEEWVVGSTRQISWTTTGSTIANVKLEYSKDNFATATVITPSTPNAGFYNWLIPSDISATVRVRVTDVNDPGTSDASDAVFKIKGGFVVTAPNGGEVWAVGTTQSIAWTNTGSVPSVKLEYSTDNFATATVIVASTANTGSFGWTVPDAISTTAKIRVSDASDPSANDASDNNFKIRGGITLSAPNGGELWMVGQGRTITWTTSGTIPDVRLEYSKDNFASVVLITAGAPGTGSFAWTVPDDLSSTVKVRVTDVRDLSVFDESNAYFKIQGALTLTSPNGGEKLTVGSAQSIAWTSVGSMANVKLQYSKDNFATAVLIAASTPNTGSFTWTVPNDISSTVRVRVTDASDVSVFDDSNATFKIQGGLTLTAPNGGEAWLVNTPRTITWNKSGSVANVKLEYSTDGGATYVGLIAASANNGTNTVNGGCTVADSATQGCYVWMIPDTVAANATVRISDAADAETFDTSNTTFRIRAAFTLASPNGGEQWLVGSTRTIGWSAVGNLPAVRLEYAKAPYVTFTLIAAAAPAGPTGGSFSWTVPNDISSAYDLKVRVSDPNDPEANDLSDNPFKITAALALTSPNGGEQWAVGSVHPITWTSTGSMANVKLEYSKDDFATSTVIVASTPNTGAYTWTIPDAISATVKVRVSDVADAEAKDLSDATFKITSFMTLLSPNGGEKWNVASTQPITWTATGTVANVKLEYSTDNFATATVISASAPNTGSYTWTIPDAISTTVQVRVSDVTDPAASDSSDATFKIQGAFALSTPNGGDAWKINTTQTIAWTTSGTVPNVKLEYSKDNFVADIRVIAASAANTGSYSWLVPDDPTTTARVRVSDVNDATVLDISDATFRIEGFFTVSAPNGGEVWPVGSTQTISWVSGGTIPSVKLEYSRDNFATATLITASTPNVSNVGGSFTWTVPNAISSTVKVRVSDVNNSAVADVSDANFAIQAGFAVTAPNGGERWITNEDRTITWTTNGTVANVKLEYSVDNFATSTVIAASVPNTGSYVWAVPDLPTVNVSNTNLRNPRATRVRVSDADAGHPAASDASNADFNVDYFLVKWLVRDVVLGTELSGLTVKHSVTVDGIETVTWSESVLTSPISRAVPANPKNMFGNRVPYKAIWMKSGYFDGSKDYLADGVCRDELGNPNPAFCPDSDLRFVVPMESTLVHTNKAVSRFVYDAATKFFTIDSWLDRDGSSVPAVKEAKVEIFDPDGASPNTPIATLDALCTVDHSTHPHPAGLPAGCPDDWGTFRQKWDFTGKTAKSYKVITTVTMTSGSAFATAETLDAAQLVGIAVNLAPGSTNLGTQLDTATQQIRSDIAGVQTTVVAIQQDTTALLQDTTTLKQDTTTLKADTTAIKQATEVTIPGKLDALQTNVTAILEDTTTKIPQRLTTLETEVKAGMKAKILNRPTTVKRGNTISIEFQSASGLSPVVNLYDSTNALRVTNATMTEIGSTGVYQYTLPVNTVWPLGDYTAVVTESTKGSLESMVLNVADADIPSLAADIAALPAQVTASVDAAAAKVDAAAAKVESASVTATAAAASVEAAAATANTAAGEVQTASETAKSAATEVTKAGAEVRAIGEKLEGRFQKVEEAASGAQGLASIASTAANDAKAIIESVRTELGARGKTQTTYDLLAQMQTLLSTVQAAVAKIPDLNNPETRKAEELRAEALHTSVQEVNTLLKKISGEGGTNLDAMYQSIAETTEEVGDLKEKVDRLKNLIDVIRQVGEKVLDRTPPKKAPVKTWFEPGGATSNGATR